MDPVKEKLWTELPVLCWHLIATITKIDHKDKTMTNLHDNRLINSEYGKEKAKANETSSVHLKKKSNKT